MSDTTPQHLKFPLEASDVGAELLDILSRGLYSDAKDAIREYLQNGVDAGADEIIISVEESTVSVRDNGTGMNLNELVRARRLGISSKTTGNHVGFRGIGIYAAFGMCDTLTLVTHEAGAADSCRLVLNFAAMRTILERDRSADSRAGIALAELLYESSDFYTERWLRNVDDHFTIARLDGIAHEYRSQLTDFAELNTYLLNTLPVAFPNESYGPCVNDWLRTEVELNAVRLKLRVGKEPEMLVAPHVVMNVDEPTSCTIRDSEGRELAFVWQALTTEGERISQDGTDEGNGTGGFLLRLKGFTLGDRNLLKPLWPPRGGRTLYYHYTGEVHVLPGSQAYPNAARDDLEPGLARQTLFRHIGDYFDDLHRLADLSREMVKIERRANDYRLALEGLEDRWQDTNEDPFEQYSIARNFVTQVEGLLSECDRLLKPGRGKKSPQLTTRQLERVQTSKATLMLVRTPAVDALKRLTKRTESTEATTSARE